MKKLIFLLMVLVMVVGCSDDETTTQPTGLEQGAAIGQAGMGAGMAVEMLGSVMDFAAMAPVVTRDDPYQSLTYENGAWTWVYTYSDENGSVSMEMWLQYLNAMGTPVPDPDDAVSMRFLIDFSGDLDLTEGDTHYISSWVYETAAEVTGLNTTVLTVDWTGSQDYSTSWTTPSGTGNVDFAMTWATGDSGLIVPLDGTCPEGSIHFSYAPYEMDMVFDGSDTASWELYWNDDDLVASGTEALECVGD
jgi:hypothetical protein